MVEETEGINTRTESLRTWKDGIPIMSEGTGTLPQRFNIPSSKSKGRSVQEPHLFTVSIIC